MREGRSVDVLAIDPRPVRARLPGLTPVRNAGAMAPCLGPSFFTHCSPLRPRCQPCLLITQAVCRANLAPLVPHFRVSILTRAGRLSHAPVPPVGTSAPVAPVVPPGHSAQSPVSTSPSQSGSEDEDESVHMQRLSVMETELRLVQRDMVQVLQLPSLGETAGSSRQSFKHMTSSAASSTPVFPVQPLELVCVERMNSIAETAKWSP